MSNKTLGNIGYGVVGGMPPEGALLRFRVDGGFVKDPTTASAQLTGTGNGSYRVDITPGIVYVDGKKLEVGAADQLLEAAGNIMASGNSKVYAVIAWMHPDTGAVALKIVAGTAATTGSQVAPSVSDIEAVIHDKAAWVHIANVTVNRTGDTTVTQSQDNTVRPTLIPKSA